MAIVRPSRPVSTSSDRAAPVPRSGPSPARVPARHAARGGAPVGRAVRRLACWRGARGHGAGTSRRDPGGRQPRGGRRTAREVGHASPHRRGPAAAGGRGCEAAAGQRRCGGGRRSPSSGRAQGAFADATRIEQALTFWPVRAFRRRRGAPPLVLASMPPLAMRTRRSRGGRGAARRSRRWRAYRCIVPRAAGRDARVRAAASRAMGRAIGRLGSATASSRTTDYESALAAALSDADPRVKVAVANALAELPGDPAMTALRRAAMDADAAVRETALDAWTTGTRLRHAPAPPGSDEFRGRRPSNSTWCNTNRTSHWRGSSWRATGRRSTAYSNWYSRGCTGSSCCASGAMGTGAGPVPASARTRDPPARELPRRGLAVDLALYDCAA